MASGGRTVGRFESQLSEVDPGFATLLARVPPQDTPPLPADWLRCEMLERFQVLRGVPVPEGGRVLEVGAGGHALTTVPLAFRVGARGRVVAAERARWGIFRQVVNAVRLGARVVPVACDARRLPFASDSFDLAACVHAVRSLRSESGMLAIFREMLRVAPGIVLAESLPEARSDAQRAHLAMYDLREDLFAATGGAPDDLHYLPMDRLVRLAERAGASVVEARVLDIDLPHALAYIPREYFDQIPGPAQREEMLRRWERADELRRRYGTDHPPVGRVLAVRPGPRGEAVRRDAPPPGPARRVPAGRARGVPRSIQIG